ncbi:MAG: hypothetical protein LBG42_04980 [Treponema sp.]|jgi:hypothetical protein|nr:hypothetical protein [Treponema sp.]
MNHATLLDALQGVWGLTSQGLEIWSKERKYELDSLLFLDNEDMGAVQSKILSQLEKYRNDPDGYKNYALNEINQWEQRSLAAGNGSRYYREQVARMKAGGMAHLEAQTFKARVQHEQDRNRADYNLIMSTIINYDDPERIKKEGLPQVTRAAQAGIINETGMADGYKLVMTAALQKEAAVPEIITEPPGVFNAKIDQLKNNPDYAIVDNRDEYIDTAKKSYLKAFQEQNFRDFEAVQNKFIALVSKGDAVSLQQAENIAIANRERLMNALKLENTGYSAEHKSQMRSWLNLPGGSGRDGGKTLTAEYAEVLQETAIRAVLKGDREYNLEDLFDFSTGLLRIEAGKAGYDINDPASVTSIQKALNGFWKTFDKVIASDEFVQLRTSYQRIKDLRAFNEGLANLYKEPGDQATLDSWLAMEALNIYGSIDFRNTDPMDIDARVDETAGQIVAMAAKGGIKDFSATGTEVTPLQDVIKMLKTRNENGYFVETDINGREIITPAPGNRALYKEKLALLDAQEEMIIAGYKSLDTGRLTPHYENEEPSRYGNNPHEKKASRIYQLDGGGTYYRLIPGEGKDFTVEEGKMQQNGTIEWGPTEGKYVSPEDAARDASREARAKIFDFEQERRSFENRMRDFLNSRPESIDDDDTSMEAQYWREQEQSLNADMRAKQGLLESIKNAANDRDRENLIQIGLSKGLLIHREAEELRRNPR